MPREPAELHCRALLFDLDGVLVDSRRCIELIWERWARERGRGRRAEEFLRVAHGRRISETLRLVAPELDIAAETAVLDAMEEVATEGLRPVAGAADLLASLAAGRWGVVTSCSRPVARLRLGAAGLPTPPVFVTAEAVPRGKPAPDGYLLGAARLGIPAADCVVIEDSPPGLAAGRAAGMRTVGVLTTHTAAALGEADLLVDRLAALAARPTPDGSLRLTAPQEPPASGSDPTGL